MVGTPSMCRARLAWTALILGHAILLSSALRFSAVYEGDDEVQEGDPFEISCTISTRDHLNWTVNGEEIPEDNFADYILEAQQTATFVFVATLRAKSAQTQHEGEYRCNGFSRDFHFLRVTTGEEEEEEEQLQHQDDDDDDDDIDLGDEDEERKEEEMYPNEMVLEPNETVTLVCLSAKDDATPVTWYKNGRRIVEGFNLNVDLDGRNLIIRSAQQDDSAEYMCTVDMVSQTGFNDIGRIFQVKSPVEVESLPEVKSIIKGRALTLHCKVSGFPNPRISWFINNIHTDILKSDPRFSIYASDSGQQNAVLNIRDMSPSDRGLYTCHAENSMDGKKTMERAETSVFVHVRENMIETNEDEPGMGKRMVLGEQLILHCNTTECPQCRVVWYKDGIPLISKDDAIRIYDDNNTVVISKASYNDSGLYVCAIDKDQSNVTLNASIIVRSDIKLEKFDSSSSVVVQGNPLELECVARGAPTPKIKWFKGENEISTSDERIILLDFGGLANAKLLIKEVDFEDRDYYTCEAYNNVSSVSTTILVRIKDKLAALWPFLGICAEVAILCSVIYAYEKKKNQTQLDESDTDHPTENKSTDQKAAVKDIRQRK